MACSTSKPDANPTIGGAGLGSRTEFNPGIINTHHRNSRQRRHAGEMIGRPGVHHRCESVRPYRFMKLVGRSCGNVRFSSMDTLHIQTLLYRIDPACNMARFYAIAIEPALFGEVSLVRRWGRIGTMGRCTIEFFDTAAEAVEAFSNLLQRKLHRGYSASGSAGSE
jgi:predicted DNA-binding WGR domain protein